MSTRRFLNTQTLMVLTLVLPVVLVTGCRKAHVTATCKQVEKYHSDLGAVNVPLYGLGKVLMLSSTANDRRAYGVGSLAYAVGDQVQGTTADKLSVKLDTSFALVFDVTVPSTVETQVGMALSRGTTIDLTKVARNELADPIGLANANAALRQQIKNGAADPTKRFVIISSMKNADGLDLRLSDDVEGKVGVNVVKYAKVKVTISYKCDGLVKMVGHDGGTGVFYGITPVKYDPNTDALVLDDRPVNVWEYDHSQALVEPE